MEAAFQAAISAFDSRHPLQITTKEDIMGMSIYANICIGAVFQKPEDNIEQSLDIYMLEEQYDGYLEEYVLDKVDNDIFELVMAGIDDYTTLILALKEFSVDTQWEPELLNIHKWSNIDIASKVKLITDELDSIDVKYGMTGLIISPYFSH